MPCIRLVIVLVALGACATDTTTTVIVPTDDPNFNDGRARGHDLADQTADDFTGNTRGIVLGKSVEILATLDAGEIQQADLAIERAGFSAVADFAYDMSADHDTMNRDLDEVVRSLGLAYIPSSVSANLAADAAVGYDALQRVAPADFDITYVELQIKQQAAAQVLIDELDSIVQTGDVDDIILDVRDMVDDHLNRALELGERLLR